MKCFAVLAVSIALYSSLCSGAEVDPDSIAKRLDAENWGHFESGKSVRWSLGKFASTNFSPAEVEFLIKWARNEEAHWPNSAREGCRVGFIILVKFKDKKTLEYVDKQFSRGWGWAWNAMESLETAGELSLLPLAGKYLNVQEATEPPPPMDDVRYSAAPCDYAVRAIGRLLRFGWQSPDHIRKAAREIERNHLRDALPIYRRWWVANEQRCLTGDFANLSSPLEYVSVDKKTP
jgi:hypothetical protein